MISLHSKSQTVTNPNFDEIAYYISKGELEQAYLMTFNEGGYIEKTYHHQDPNGPAHLVIHTTISCVTSSEDAERADDALGGVIDYDPDNGFSRTGSEEVEDSE